MLVAAIIFKRLLRNGRPCLVSADVNGSSAVGLSDISSSNSLVLHRCYVLLYFYKMQSGQMTKIVEDFLCLRRTTAVAAIV